MLDWDRSHEWVLYRFWNDQTRVTIRFRQPAPSVAELVALRRCLPQFRDVAAADLRARFGEVETLDLGTLPTQDARRLLEAVRGQGLEVSADGAFLVSYLPFDRTTGCAWLIEDEAESRAVAQAMLDAGIAVQDVEA